MLAPLWAWNQLEVRSLCPSPPTHALSKKEKIKKKKYRCFCSCTHVLDKLACFTGPSVFKENCLNSDVVEQIYKRNPILRHTHHPLHSPLLPLPYGDINLNCECPAPATPRSGHRILFSGSLLSSVALASLFVVMQGSVTERTTLKGGRKCQASLRTPSCLNVLDNPILKVFRDKSGTCLAIGQLLQQAFYRVKSFNHVTEQPNWPTSVFRQHRSPESEVQGPWRARVLKPPSVPTHSPRARVLLRFQRVQTPRVTTSVCPTPSAQRQRLHHPSG